MNEIEWKQELEKMQEEKEFAKGEYLDMIAEQKEDRQLELEEAEREKIIRKHRMDCIYLKQYGKTMDECREYYKDIPHHDCHKKNDYDFWLCEKENSIPAWTDFNYINLGSNKSGYSGVNN